MRRVSIALLISLFAMYGSAAVAVDFPNGLYWGGNMGVSDDLDSCDKLPIPSGFDSPTNCKDSDFGWQLFLGWQLLKWVSFEGGFTDLGGSSVVVVQDRTSTSIDGWNLGGVFTAPYLEKIGLYGTAGAFFWDVEVTNSTSLTGESSSVSDTGTDYYYGFGFRLPISPKIGMNLAYTRFDQVGNSKVGTTDINLWTAGLLFRF